MNKLEVLNPVAHVRLTNPTQAPSLGSLENKRIGLYWNGKAGGDIALTRIGELLESKFAGVKVELIRSSLPGPKEKVDYAKTFQLVIGSTGD